jgi:uncharacterized 2Fe-2S/4Fe-4S cluster protein (DUF4445 family)
MTRHHLISFQPSGKRVPTAGRETLLQLAHGAKLPIESVCGGQGTCGKCRILIPLAQGRLLPPTEKEISALGNLIEKGYRLACEMVPASDLTCTIPEASLVSGQVILTSSNCRPSRLKPDIMDFSLEIPPPTLSDPASDLSRLIRAFQKTYGRQVREIDTLAMREIASAVRSQKGRITAFLWKDRELIDVRAGNDEAVFGIAFDIGTTTVVAYLLDLRSGREVSVASAMNPQVPYGDNVISRITYCLEDEKGLEKLRSILLALMNQLIDRLCQKAGIKNSQVLEATVVGNTVMHHLFLGLDPRSIALAPYNPVVRSTGPVKARDLRLHISPSGYVVPLPVKAGFVGGDTIGVVIATNPHRKSAMTLAIDIGTNGEIVLGNRGRLLCCSTAAGPAFEGGHIKWGMRATKGAVEKVEIDPATLNVRIHTIGNRPPLGLCGTGTISVVAALIRARVITSHGSFNPAVSHPRLRPGDGGTEFVLAWAGETGTKNDLVITQQDVAELQLAKGAIRAGITILMKKMGIKKVHRVLLAGAFGTYVEVQDAWTIGLIPSDLCSQVESVGNAAGAGACLALLNRDKQAEAERMAEKMEYVELSVDPDFNELFIDGMLFDAPVPLDKS